MNIGRICIALLSLSLLSSCATGAQMQAQRINTNNRLFFEQFKTCIETVRQSPDYVVLLKHVPLTFQDVSLEQMSDDSKATKKEISALYATNPRSQACKKEVADSLMTTTPTLVPIFVDGWQKRDALEIDLIKRKISWGEFITRSREVATSNAKESSAAMQQLGAQLQQSHVAELQQRQQAANNAAQYFQNQQLINSMNRPRMTNCTGFGNMVNCTTY